MAHYYFDRFIDWESFSDQLAECSAPLDYVKRFLDSYIESALWSSTDDDGEPLDNNYGIDDISTGTLVTMAEDCIGFLSLVTDMEGKYGEELENWYQGSSQYSAFDVAGHDFWLTRERHGAGFWDGDWKHGQELTDLAQTYSGNGLYVGDDGKIYQP